MGTRTMPSYCMVVLSMQRCTPCNLVMLPSVATFIQCVDVTATETCMIELSLFALIRAVRARTFGESTLGAKVC